MSINVVIFCVMIFGAIAGLILILRAFLGYSKAYKAYQLQNYDLAFIEFNKYIKTWSGLKKKPKRESPASSASDGEPLIFYNKDNK
ncbi:MAG: hypothetical protein HUJ62_05255 [Streptococcus gallolyticus]|nr:hypothetical protein [Streptococcus gallolyticus]